MRGGGSVRRLDKTGTGLHKMKPIDHEMKKINKKEEAESAHQCNSDHVDKACYQLSIKSGLPGYGYKAKFKTINQTLKVGF